MNTDIKIIKKSLRKKYLFVLCPPYNGSTVLYKILDSSPNVSTFLGTIYKVVEKNNGINKEYYEYLIPRGEGHCLLIDNKINDYEKKRHKFGYKIPLKEMKELYDRYWDLNKKILCDKSPPYVHYAKEIEEYFSQFGDVYFICMIRNPYSCKWIRESPWPRFAKLQQYNITHLKNVCYFRYEDLVTHPEKVKKQLLDFLPELQDIDMNTSSHKGLNKEAKRNKELTTDYRDRITHQEEKNVFLEQCPNELDFFGYPFMHTC